MCRKNADKVPKSTVVRCKMKHKNNLSNKSLFFSLFDIEWRKNLINNIM